MSDVKPPPYPADTLAKGWRFELAMEQFKRSDTWKLAKTGAIRGALMLLWAEAWQESPCGTLPNDDELVALTIDMPLATFQKNRGVLMRGWSLASDGRLYHETITTRVLAMLEKRASDAARTAKRRAALAEAKATHGGDTGVSRVTPAGLNGDSDASSPPSTKHQAPEKKKKPPTPSGDGFGLFWAAWPKSTRKGGKAACEELWRRDGLEALAAEVVAHVQAMAKTEGWKKEGGEFVPAPAVYLRQKRWDGADLSATPAPAGKHNGFDRIDYREGVADDGSFT
jgi:hypothetical protein